MLSSRFFRRIFLPYLLLICGATGTVGVFAAMRLHGSYLRQTRQTLQNEALLVSDVIQGDLARSDAAAVERQTKRLGAALNRRITVIADDGTVLGENEADPLSMENHRQRPEVLDADQNGDGASIRPSRTVGADLLYLAHRTQTPDGRKFFVRLSVHLSELDRQLRVLYAALATVVFAAIAAAAVLCFYLARRHAAPVVELTDFARALAGGDLHRRLVSSTNGEVGHLTTALNTMADSLSGLISQTTKDRAELLAMLSSMSEGVIATDTRQRVLLVNQRAADLLEFSAGDAQGKPLWEIIRQEGVLKAAAEVLARTERKAFQISPSVGRHLEITACTFPVGSKPEGLILVAHDTTQSVRYQELRKEFVANVSHELRTPLTVIKGFTETLKDGALKDPVSGPKFLGTIERHVDQLTNLVSDLLELSRLESAPDLPRRVHFDLAALVRRAADLLAPAAQRKNQTLTVDVNKPLPRLFGNPDYIERAVSNLIDNAIKYTPEQGAISVNAFTDGNWAVVDVFDNGIGIPPEDLSRVFERFYRVDRSRSRDMGGTGLGLSIVKHVAQAHGGTIEVSSTPGAGSRFRLKLPIRSDGN